MALVAPLAGIRVVTVEQAVAGPLCSRHLADLGADVIKVEQPGGGDFARRYDSVIHGLSAYFVWLNYGKRSIALDLKDEDDRRLLDDLLAGADVFLQNLGPGVVTRLGLGYDALHARHPALVMCSISGFGPSGPYSSHKAFDLIVQGEAGLMSVTGSADAPARVGISVADISAGMYALSSILAALIERQRTGAGTHLEISMLESLTEWMNVPIAYARYTGSAPPRTGPHHATIAPYGAFTTGTGDRLLIAVQNEGQWTRLCRSVLARPELAEDENYSTNELRVRNRHALHAIIEPELRGRATDELARALTEADVPFGSINDPHGVMMHPQLAADGWRDVGSPAGPVTVTRSPLDARPGAVPAVPGFDEHGAEIRSLAWSDFLGVEQG